MSTQSNKQEWVVMGRVMDAFGIRGWVKIQPFTEYLDSLFDYETWWIHPRNKPDLKKAYLVEEAQVHGKVLVAALEGIEDRDQALALKGMTISVSRADFPEAEEDEYYWHDLVSMEVVLQSGECLGQVVEMMETGAHDLLVVENAQKKRILIPFVAQYVLNVVRETKTITVDWDPTWLDD